MTTYGFDENKNRVEAASKDDVTSLTTRVSGAESSVTTLTTRVSSTESNISSLKSRVSSAENDISNLESSIKGDWVQATSEPSFSTLFSYSDHIITVLKDVKIIALNGSSSNSIYSYCTLCLEKGETYYIWKTASNSCKIATMSHNSGGVALIVDYNSYKVTAASSSEFSEGSELSFTTSQASTGYRVYTR